MSRERMNTWRELPHTPCQLDSDYPNYRERRMNSDELEEARDREIERILADDDEIETALIEAGTPKGIAPVVVWLYRNGHHLPTRGDVIDFEREVDRTVERIVDNRRSDVVRY